MGLLGGYDGESDDLVSLYRTLAHRTVPLALERGSITQAVANAIVDLLDNHPTPQ